MHLESSFPSPPAPGDPRTGHGASAVPGSAHAVVTSSSAMRNGLLLMGLAQGALVYLLAHAMDWGGAGHQGRTWLALCLLLVVQVPLFMGMAVGDWRSSRLWLGGGVMAVVLLVMGGWATWVGQSPGTGGNGAVLRLVVAASLWWLVALAWFQGYLELGHWRIPYARLFVHAWNNALVMALASLCMNLVWCVLWLWAGLFSLLGVHLFADFFSQAWFIYLCTGGLLGLGLWMARTQERPIQMARQTLLALGRLLLPLMAWVLVLFVGMLAFTGVQPLWAMRYAAGLLMGVLLVHIWLVNAVFQEGEALRGPYARWLLLLVQGSLLAMPVLATLVCVAIGLRVQQYGWTNARVWAAAGAVVLWLYAAGYAAAALRSWKAHHPGPWLAWVGSTNRLLSWLVLVVLLALQTPVLDPDRISAHSQQARLASGAQEATLQRLMALKLDHGRYGGAALQALAQAPALQGAEQQLLLQTALDRSSRSPEVDAPAVTERVDVPLARQRIALARGHVAPQADWWPWLVAQADAAWWVAACVRQDADCVLLSGDWDRDGQVDHWLCDLARSAHEVRCQLTARDAQGQWQHAAGLNWPGYGDQDVRAATRQALRDGQLQTPPQRWPQWQLPVPFRKAEPLLAGQTEAPR